MKNTIKTINDCFSDLLNSDKVYIRAGKEMADGTIRQYKSRHSRNEVKEKTIRRLLTINGYKFVDFERWVKD